MKHPLLAIAALAVLCACTRIEPETPDTPAAERFVKITISARADNPDATSTATKSSRDAEGRFYWSPSDRISLFKVTATGTEGNWQLTSTNTSPAQEATFRGEIPAEALQATGKYWAIYPYAETNSFDGTSLTTTVPDQQTATKGTFADGQFISIGCSEDLSMTFYHLCGGFKFKLQSPGITTVTLSGLDNEPLAGKVQVTLDANGFPVVQQVSEPQTTITLSCPDGFTPGEEYFFVTLPVQFQHGIQFTFNGSLTRTVETTMRINRAKFQWSSTPIDSRMDGFPITEFNIENSGVHAYMAEVDYSDDPNYTRSDVQSYSGSDSPNSFSLSWSGSASKIQLSTDPFFSAPFELANTSTSASIPNLAPGITYYYRVLNRSNTVLKQGAVRPTGLVRMIQINGLYNTRDLGGWPTINGKHIAYGKIFRGPQLNNLRTTEAKNYFLNFLGVTVDLDLRGKSGETPKKDLADVKIYQQLTVLKFFDEGKGNTQNLYKKAIRLIIGWLEQGEVVYIHCLGGADRTSTLAFLIEALVGMNESDLSKEYELVNFGVHDRYRNAVAPDKYRITDLIYFLRQEQFGYPETTSINELVYNWATSVTDDPADPDGAIPPLTPAEIDRLRQLLLVQD